jgi:single-strand DNA-binding protein
MSSRSLNKVMLIGNLTRDPELRYTPTGAAVCTIGLATNRSWTTESGEKKEETEFHRVVAWNKLAELCSQLLTKGRKIYIEGRLRTNSWQTADGGQRSTTEVVIEDMILLDSRRLATETGESGDATHPVPSTSAVKPVQNSGDNIAVSSVKSTDVAEDVNPDDIPF